MQMNFTKDQAMTLQGCKFLHLCELGHVVWCMAFESILFVALQAHKCLDRYLACFFTSVAFLRYC